MTFRRIMLLFFFNDTATTEIYTLSLHDALPIWGFWASQWDQGVRLCKKCLLSDRKSTRLNSSHLGISYAVFYLKKKTKTNYTRGSTPESTSCSTSKSTLLHR